MDRLENKLSDEKMKQLEIDNRVRYIPYAGDNKFFAVIDEKDLYYIPGNYKLLKKNFK